MFSFCFAFADVSIKRVYVFEGVACFVIVRALAHQQRTLFKPELPANARPLARFASRKFSTAPANFIRVIAKDIKHHVDDSLGNLIIS